VTLAPLPLLHRSHDARLLLSTAYPDRVYSLFPLIVGLLEFFLLLVESFEVVVLCNNDLGSAIELALEVRDFSFQGFNVWNGFFAPLSA